MRLRRTLAAPLVSLTAGAVALGTLAGASAAPTPYDGGLSTPREDSYYPQHGDPGVDTLHYGLRLAWHPRTRVLSGVADVALRATADAPSFQLDLAHAMRVARVRIDGARVASTHSDDVLHVRNPVEADRRYDVRVVYRGTPEPTPAPTTRSDQRLLGMRVTRDGELRTMQEPFGAFTW